MRLYEIVGRKDSELENEIFGHFTTKDLAKTGYENLPEEFQEETEIRQSNLPMNAIEIDNQIVSSTPVKTPKEVIASRDKNNYVTGYIRLHVSDIIDNDLEGFIDVISEKLIGSDILMDVNYDIIAMEDANSFIVRVSGDVSAVLEMEEK